MSEAAMTSMIAPVNHKFALIKTVALNVGRALALPRSRLANELEKERERGGCTLAHTALRIPVLRT